MTRLLSPHRSPPHSHSSPPVLARCWYSRDADGYEPGNHAQQSNRKDRREAVFLNVRLVANGTKRTWGAPSCMALLGGKADLEIVSQGRATRWRTRAHRGDTSIHS